MGEEDVDGDEEDVDAADDAGERQFSLLEDRKKEEERSNCPRLDFLDDPRFQVVIGTVTVSNAMAVAGETDFPDWPRWWLVDNIFMVILICEFFLHLINKGFKWYKTKRMWAVFNTIIIIEGVLDLWVAPFLLPGEQNIEVLRCIRLLRLIRVLRIFEMFTKLEAFLQALGVMFKTFVWVFLVLLVSILSIAIILTHVLGHGEALVGRPEKTAPPDCPLHTEGSRVECRLQRHCRRTTRAA